ARLALPEIADQEGRPHREPVVDFTGGSRRPSPGGIRHRIMRSRSCRMRCASRSPPTASLLSWFEPGGFKTAIWDDNQRDVASRGDSRYRGAYERTLQLTRMSQPVMGDPARCARVIVRALIAPGAE